MDKVQECGSELRCKGCNTVLCTLKGSSLLFGPAAVTSSVTIRCVACGYRRKWCPPKVLDARPKPG